MGVVIWGLSRGELDVSLAAEWCKKHELEMPQFAELAQCKLCEENKELETAQRGLAAQVHPHIVFVCCC